jgi:hypothetical protein
MRLILVFLLAYSSLLLIGCVTWTPHSNQLAQLVRKNTACRVRLQPVWEGKAKPTVLTGSFASISWFTRDESDLHFDWFTFRDKPSPLHVGPRTISKDIGGGLQTAMFTFRTSLPGDKELSSASALPSLEHLLGPPQDIVDGWRGLHGEEHLSEGWGFFTLSGNATIETLDISCMATRRRSDSEYRVDDLKVVRGVAKPKQ